MVEDIDMGERHGRVLAELAEVGMTMVRRLSEAMLQARDPQTQAQLGLAFHRASRAVRQTLALEFRLAQEARRLERDRAAPVATAPPSPTRAPAPPRPPSERIGWDEYESSDADDTLDELDGLLQAEHPDLEAVHAAVETCIAGIRHDLDIELPVAPISSPAGGGAPAEGRWRENNPAPALPAARRSALLGAAALPRPPLTLPPSASPLHAWRSSA